MGHFGLVLELPGGSWEALGGSWGDLGGSWRGLGSFLGALGASWCDLGGSRLGSIGFIRVWDLPGREVIWVCVCSDEDFGGEGGGLQEGGNNQRPVTEDQRPATEDQNRELEDQMV